MREFFSSVVNVSFNVHSGKAGCLSLGHAPGRRVCLTHAIDIEPVLGQGHVGLEYKNEQRIICIWYSPRSVCLEGEQQVLHPCEDAISAEDLVVELGDVTSLADIVLDGVMFAGGQLNLMSLWKEPR